MLKLYDFLNFAPFIQINAADTYTEKEVTK